MSLHPAFEVSGCDISSNQGIIDFDKMFGAGISFVIARGSIGMVKDTRYQAYKADIVQRGKPLGVYAAWWPGVSSAVNANTLIAAQPDALPMRQWLDCEVLTSMSLLQSSRHILDTTQALDDHYNEYTGLYFNRESWRRLIDPSYYNLFELDSRPLWVANYIDTLADSTPALPDGWPTWHIWQFSAAYGPYSGKGATFGVSSASLDIDAFNGTEQEYYKFIGQEVQPPEPPPAVIPARVRVKTSGTNIRNAPNLTIGSDIGDLTKDAVLDVIGDATQFWKVQAYVAKSVVEPVIPTPPVIPEYRVAHDTEYQAQWRSGVPEVFLLEPIDLTTPIPEHWQWLCYALNCPGITPKQHRQLFDWQRAFTNFNAGYDNPGGKLHCDFINGRDLTSPPPWFDKPRVCGGAILRGKLTGDILAVETLNGNNDPPLVWTGGDWDAYVASVAVWAKEHYWLFFRAVTIASNGENYNFPQGNGQPVLIPLVTSAPVTVKINNKVLGKPIQYVVRHDREDRVRGDGLQGTDIGRSRHQTDARFTGDIHTTGGNADGLQAARNTAEIQGNYKPDNRQ